MKRINPSCIPKNSKVKANSGDTKNIKIKTSPKSISIVFPPKIVQLAGPKNEGHKNGP